MQKNAIVSQPKQLTSRIKMICCRSLQILVVNFNLSTQPISAQRGNNVHELEKIVPSTLREGVHSFPRRLASHGPLAMFYGIEIIREKLMVLRGRITLFCYWLKSRNSKVKWTWHLRRNNMVYLSLNVKVRKWSAGAGGQKIKTIGGGKPEPIWNVDLITKVHLELG